MEAKTYNIREIQAIAKENNWILTIVQKEKDGIPCDDNDTILVQGEDEGDYFGEFSGNPVENEYKFEFYNYGRV